MRGRRGVPWQEGWLKDKGREVNLEGCPGTKGTHLEVGVGGGGRVSRPEPRSGCGDRGQWFLAQLVGEPSQCHYCSSQNRVA